MTRAILDFPDRATEPRVDSRLLFREPRGIIAAGSVGDVLPRLREVEAAVASGLWAVGFVAYEAAPAFDDALQTRPHAGPAPLLWFALFDGPVAAPPPVIATAPPLEWCTHTPRHVYDEAVSAIREGIAAGDFYQVNHTLRFQASFEREPRSVYDGLTAHRHGLYHAFIETDDWAVVSASPELFIERVGDRITTRPMKGTIRRGRWLQEDQDMARRLADSGKDRAENLMIVDLLRNDLGRVARFGSVEVPHLFEVETYPTVHQLTSTVTAQLRPDTSLCDIFTAMFPCGSVTGAPKVAAMQAIARLEDTPRGPYCGAVGVLRPDGSATFNVAIRTIVVERATGRAVYGAGGGITWDSVADAEFDEVIAKASLLRGALPDLDLLETMRLEDGVISRFDLHMARLRDSARFFAFPAGTADSAAAALRRVCHELGTGSWRVRLTASRTGSINISHTRLHDPVGTRADEATPRRAALSRQPVPDHEPLLFHKTTARNVYDQRRGEDPDAFDVLLLNQRHELTEFTTGNLVVELDGSLLTPARHCGLLAGTLRQQLLDEGVIREAVIHAHRLADARRAWHLNSVRGWTAAFFE
jgi:para-aminobenzoate synthetase / 4-amino-4-deoxychorismate lyase